MTRDYSYYYYWCCCCCLSIMCIYAGRGRHSIEKYGHSQPAIHTYSDIFIYCLGLSNFLFCYSTLIIVNGDCFSVCFLFHFISFRFVFFFFFFLYSYRMHFILFQVPPVSVIVSLFTYFVSYCMYQPAIQSSLVSVCMCLDYC